MHLRHIRPRSIEWYDAVEWELAPEAQAPRLSPEETLKLRTLVAVEEAADQLRGYRPRRPD